MPELRTVKTRSALSPSATPPKFTVPPAGRSRPACSSAISGATPVPCIAKLYEPSSESVLGMIKVAPRVPMADGSKVTAKVMLAPGLMMGEEGWVTVKSPDPARMTKGLPDRLSTPLPELLMVKTRVTEPPVTGTAPKSV